MQLLIALSVCTLFAITDVRAAFNLQQAYSGSSFFTGWDFSGGFDSTTLGHVNWLTNATSAGLAFTNDAGNAIIKVDNTSSVAYPNKRNSVRMQTQTFFPIGSMFVIDAVHIPYGCSVWPALWTTAASWPQGGEIDIVEQVNLATQNQMTLHTTEGCTQAINAQQSGKTVQPDCSLDDSFTGCSVLDTQGATFGKAFADNGGGAWATQFDENGISIWFWPRNKIPDTVTNAKDSIDSSDWGTPSAAWSSSSCDITKFFQPQQLVIDITLCGKLAGSPPLQMSGTYNDTCGGPPANSTYDTCYQENVINLNHTSLDTAYFELSYIKVFTSPNATTTSTTGTSSSGNSPTQGSMGGNSGALPSAHVNLALTSVVAAAIASIWMSV